MVEAPCRAVTGSCQLRTGPPCPGGRAHPSTGRPVRTRVVAHPCATCTLPPGHDVLGRLTGRSFDRERAIASPARTHGWRPYRNPRPAPVPMAPREGPARLRGRRDDRKASRRRVGSGVSWQRPWMAAVASAYRDVRPSGCDTPGLPRLPPKPAALPLQRLPLRFQWPLRRAAASTRRRPTRNIAQKKTRAAPGATRVDPARLRRAQPFSAASTRAVISSMLPTPSIRVSVPRFS